MKRLSFYGRSDDLLTADVNGEPTHEAGAFGRGGAFRIKASDGALRVVGHYGAANTSCWAIGVAPDAEGAPLPVWPMYFMLAEPEGFPNPKTASTLLVIEAPDDAVIIDVENEK